MLATDVETADGVVRGRRAPRAVQWRSIPYAAAPVGELRLRAPQPVQPWAGVRDATRFGCAAVQRRNPMVALRRTGEDCLTLNVTAPPDPSARSRRPVLVFLHGGGYLFDTAARYPGDSLAARGDVVVVTLNYRLGALGYVDFTEFSTADRPFESNLGLRDQVAALRWVRRNIAAFGGDPDNVTLFGESSGADAVLTLMATPAAAGLFHRAIAQSPAADWAAVDAEAARRFARRLLGRFLGRLGVAPDSAARALTTAAAKDLCRAAEQALREVVRAFPGSYPIAPVVDGAFLPQDPLDVITTGSAQAVPLIVGTNRDECALSRFDATVPTTAPALRAALQRCGADHERVATAYPGYPKRAAAVRLSTDFVLWRPAQAVLEGHSGRAPTFSYRFDFAPRALRLAGLGAVHGIELLPVFGGVDSMPVRLLTLAGGRQGFRAVQREVQDNWLAFARTGRPLASWPAYTAAQRNTRIIDHPSRTEVDPQREHRLLWEGVRVPAAG
ncbi:carboxylesterase/lipase family protein [Kitasatospora sp. NPDC097643]|uniref:carboxylesterase/lipase family protein n=1 Tax=Kitasatospora sp. NPDC097643 TaxID=3157230 RepID=UPI003328058F